MYKLTFLPLAKKDMDEIVYYISFNLKNKKAALDSANEFIKNANNILTFSYGASEYTSLVNKLEYTYRCVKIKNFYMFYVIDEDKKVITIVRVLYRKRNIDKLLK